ncbi:TPA: AlpA family transcriptional regulator [Vibrio parahaemolyticus]|uniref:helix-turn-helix transcriptional regulator n=1 Tax=Vibrio parahaemolyticus TaxID=670 RepID=UPI00248C3030|nr:AlpA family transcriptional regulator [Vibrio parahaemolyticus]HBK3325498.1 AlpA family transcriptional regulator [Vibrio parahaemolyticus]
MSTRLIRLNEVMAITGLSRSSIYRYIDEGRFPEAVSIGSRTVAWVDREILRWVESRIENRDSNVLYGYGEDIKDYQSMY